MLPEAMKMQRTANPPTLPVASREFSTYRQDIQLLRAVAIILVVLAHAGTPFLKGGYVGVDVFFVISGYLITQILTSQTSEDASILKFYARRLKRLLPALIFMLMGSLLIASALLTSKELSEQTKSLPFAATWTSNFYFAFTEVDYFAELEAKDLFLHTWSLGLEEQFNIIWPLLITAILAFNRKFSRRKDITPLIAALFLISLLLSAASAYIFNSSKSYYLLHTRLWEFLAGAFVYLHFIKENNSSHRLLTHSPVIGIFLIICAAVSFDEKMPYPGLLAIIPVLGTCLILARPTLTQPQIAKPLFFRFLKHVGDRSYSWYLWHWPILILGQANIHNTTWHHVLMLVLISYALACISYRIIELPFWQGKFSRLPRDRVLQYSAVGMLLPIALSANISTLNFLLNPAPPVVVSASSLARSDLPWIYNHSCDESFKKSDVKPCFSGNLNASKTVALLGDSIGAQWASILPKIFPQSEWKYVILTKSSCPMVDEDVYFRDRTVYKNCSIWREGVLKYISNIKPAAIILGSASGYPLSKEQWINGTSRVLNIISSPDTKTYIIAGTPILGFDGPACIEKLESSKHDATSSQCSKPIATDLFQNVNSYLQEAAKKSPGTQVVDLNNFVCPESVCHARQDNGIFVFRDSQHLTDTFVQSISGDVAKLFEPR